MGLLNNGIRRVWKTRTWEDNWNNAIMKVLFTNTDLKNEMLIPPAKQSNLKAFIDQYFVEDVASDKIIINEEVRIVWHIEANPFIRGSANVHQKYLILDIYVKNERLHDVTTTNRLASRDVAIAKRIRYLLTRTKSVENISFEYADEFRLMSKLVGYQRLRLVFFYYATY